MILYTKVRKKFNGRKPTKRTHRAFIRAAEMVFQLLVKVITGIKLVAGIEFVVIFTVTAFDLPLVSRGIRLNKLMSYTELCSGSLKQCRLIL